ncbi:peptidase domain-containing ABC transporter [Undibacterium sp. TS12]|uniref:peptidase domain-containing ABC transporter n=1 Tax=Undibacterium sp. TS12 TaxID=2908202 RepID=UPI00321997E6
MIFDALNMGWRNRVPLILQSEAAECGLACLAMLAGYHGYETNLLALRQRFSLSLRGANLKHLIDIAQKLNFSTRAIRIELEDLAYLPTPAILHWNMNHFVVLVSVNTSADGSLKHIVIHDPGSGECTCNAAEVAQRFTGIALEIAPAAGFEARQEKQALSITHLLGHIRGLSGAVVQIVALALGLELLALAAPFYMQLVVDSALLSADRQLLTLLALGFGLLLVIQTTLSLMRSWMLLVLSTHMNLQWLANIFHHLIRLPLAFFEKRHLGDVMSRFNSVQAIQRTLTTSFIEAMLDGILALSTLTMMFIYSPGLSALVLAFAVLYAVLRFAFYSPLRRANEESLNMAAREQTMMMESLRAIQSIKLFAHENQRQQRWYNALASTTNRQVRFQKIGLGFSFGRQLLNGLENVLVIWLGAKLAMNNVFSVGMLFAFISYKTTFSTRIFALVDKWMELKMVGLQAERLADIVLTAPDTCHSENERLSLHQASPESLALSVRNLGFRYADGEPWIIKNCSFDIQSGESLALIGASGCGKTTLVKLMLGLLTPTEGEIYINGQPLSQFGMQAYRSHIAAVMQDDQLLSGSILDNLSFFDQKPDMERVSRCAQMAAISSDIENMPMAWQTLIGDMGSSLSGGQKQRLLLARALYRQPKLLFLDEATSHLDVTREAEVNQAVSQLAITRVIVAHRPETIKSADRVIEMAKGEIVRDLRRTPAGEDLDKEKNVQ